MEKKIFTTEFGGRELTVEFNNIVDQAHGSCLVKYGDTVVLATAVMTKEAKEGTGFFRLIVDFDEKFYATGKILGSRFQKREGRPTDEAILSGRIVDRTIRPFFDNWIRNEIQVVLTVLSIGEDDPDILAVLAASVALGTSHIPWNGPVSAVRIGLNSSEEEILKGMGLGKIELQKLQKFQEKIFKEIAKEKIIIPKPKISKKTLNLFKEKIESIFMEKLFSGNPGKGDLSHLVTLWKKEIDVLEDPN